VVVSSQTIDGKYIVLTDRTALPTQCVRKNQPVSEREYRKWDLPWIPIWLKIVMLLCPILLIVTPYAVRQRCRLKAGLSRGVWFRYFLLKLAAGFLILGSLVAPIAYAAADLQQWAIVAAALFPFCFWGGFAILILFSSPLSIAKVEGDLFWIKGCSPDFLESLRRSVG